MSANPIGILPHDRRPAPRAPRHLSEASRALFRSIVAEFVMEPHDHQVLTIGLEALDRANAARTAIDADGMTVLDRFGQARPHPLLVAETQARAQVLAAFRQLGLDYTPVKPAEQTAAARQARWAK